MIHIAEIKDSVFSLRRTVMDEEIQSLAASIAVGGLLQPVGVAIQTDGGYQSVFGARRIEAVRSLGWSKIPAIVLEGDDLQAVAVLENLQRKDLSTPEIAVALKELAAREHWSQDRIASLLGKDKSSISKTVKLGHLVQEYMGVVSFTKLPTTVYWELLDTPELLVRAEDERWKQKRARTEARKLLDRRDARDQRLLDHGLAPCGAGSGSAASPARKRGTSGSSPIVLFRGGFKVMPFTFRADSSQNLEAVIERMTELQQKLESAIYVLRQLQFARKDGKQSRQLDFQADFLGLPDGSAPVEQL